MNRLSLFSAMTIVGPALCACVGDAITPPTVSHLVGDNGQSNKTGRVSNPRSTFVFVAPSASAGSVAGDGRLADGSASTTAESVYDDGQCGVESQIFVNNTGDVTVDPIYSKSTSRNCRVDASIPRAMKIQFGSPIAAIAGTSLPSPVQSYLGGDYANLHEVMSIPHGTTASRRFAMLLRGTGAAYCDELAWGADGGTSAQATINDTPLTSGPVQATAAATGGDWTASSQPDGDGHHVAFCTKNGIVVAAFDVTIQVHAIQKP